jgi:hypothetical protein
MTVRQVIVYVATCGRELGQGYGHRETYDTADEANQAARVAGWSTHPDGQHYCQKGQHT